MSTSALEARLIRLETRDARKDEVIAALLADLRALEQDRRVAQTGTYNGGGSGSPQKSYWCVGDGTAHVATGTWPSLTADTFTSDVYEGDGTSLTLVASGATINWFFKDAMSTTAGALIPCNPNSDGVTYDAMMESCAVVI